jgi:hypothetical protein
MGVLTSVHERPGAGMDWRVTIELSGADGTKQTYEVARGGGSAPDSSLDPLGLTLDDSKALLAGAQRHLVRGRVAEYSALRRRCSHCQSLRPPKYTRARRLNSLFGTVEVPAPRFKPCRCAITEQSTLSPAWEFIPDRCTPKYERTLAKLGLVPISLRSRLGTRRGRPSRQADSVPHRRLPRAPRHQRRIAFRERYPIFAAPT